MNKITVESVIAQVIEQIKNPKPAPQYPMPRKVGCGYIKDENTGEVYLPTWEDKADIPKDL